MIISFHYDHGGLNQRFKQIFIIVMQAEESRILQIVVDIANFTLVPYLDVELPSKEFLIGISKLIFLPQPMTVGVVKAWRIAPGMMAQEEMTETT